VGAVGCRGAELTAAAFELLNTAQAFYLMAVRDLDSRPGAVAGARPGRVAKTFLELRLRRFPGWRGCRGCAGAGY
jgi:hypothetical protein